MLQYSSVQVFKLLSIRFLAYFHQDMFGKSANASLDIFRLFEQDSLSGRSHFPWMQLHCNFQGLATGPKSDRNIQAAGVSVSEVSLCVCVCVYVCVCVSVRGRRAAANSCYTSR